MNKTFRWVALAALLVMLAIPTLAFAATPQVSFFQSSCGGLVFGGSCTLQSGTTHRDDMVVFGGSVEIETDATVSGDLVNFGGSVVSDGTVSGDLVMLGGSVVLLDNAVVGGDLAVMGGSVDRSDGAVVEGDIITENTLPVTIDIPFSDLPQIVIPSIEVNPFDSPFNSGFGMGFNLVWEIFWGIARIIGLALLAVLVGLLAGKQTRRVAKAAASEPVLAGGYGLLTYLVALPIFLFFSIIIIVVLAITIILLPVSIMAALAMSLVLMLLGIAALYGWIALGLEIGDRLAAAFGREWPVPASAGLGTLLLSLAAVFIGMIWCIGPLAVLLVSSVGLGGVVLTRFGTRDYGDLDEEVVDEVPPAIPPTLGEDELEEAPAELEAPADEAPAVIADPGEEPAPEVEAAEEAPETDEASETEQADEAGE